MNTLSRLWNTYAKRFIIRLVTVFFAAVVAYALQDGQLDTDDLEGKAIYGAIAAGFYALIALISPGEPHVGPVKTNDTP